MTGEPAGWYPGPGLDGDPDTAGQVLRWWTGTAWGPQVAELDTHPDPPPGWWHESGDGTATEALTLPPTTAL
jgi:hypothetical protein